MSLISEINDSDYIFFSFLCALSWNMFCSVLIIIENFKIKFDFKLFYVLFYEIKAMLICGYVRLFITWDGYSICSHPQSIKPRLRIWIREIYSGIHIIFINRSCFHGLREGFFGMAWLTPKLGIYKKKNTHTHIHTRVRIKCNCSPCFTLQFFIFRTGFFWTLNKMWFFLILLDFEGR